MAPKLPKDTPGPVPSRLTPLNGLRHPRAHSSSTSDTSTVTTEPTRTKQAPGHSLTGRRETQTAERREKERERWRERCRNGLPPQPAKNRVRNTGEETLTESRPWEERVQPSRWPSPRGHFTPGTVGGDPHLSPSCAQTNPANGQFLVGTRASEPPGHSCGSCQHECSSSQDMDASGPGCWKSPVLPAQRLCPMQGHQPAPSQLCTPAVGPGGTVMPGWGHWPRDHCTLSQDNEARVPPEQQRAQTDEKKEGRRNAR